MLRNKWFALPVVLLAFAMFANAGPIINVYTTLGPSPFGASYNDFVDNVVIAMQSADPTIGTGTGMAAYNPITMIAPNQPIESNFESWQGLYSPGSLEYGTDLYFALHIKDTTGGTFSLSQLSWNGTAPATPPDFHSYASDTYENHRRGYVGGVLTYGSGQAGNLPVDELIYVGVSNYWPAPDNGPGNEQADLNAQRDLLATFAGQYITGKYTLSIAGAEPISGEADVQFSGIPEPGTIALGAMGLAAMLFVRRKR